MKKSRKITTRIYDTIGCKEDAYAQTDEFVDHACARIITAASSYADTLKKLFYFLLNHNKEV